MLLTEPGRSKAKPSGTDRQVADGGGLSLVIRTRGQKCGVTNSACLTKKTGWHLEIIRRSVWPRPEHCTRLPASWSKGK